MGFFSSIGSVFSSIAGTIKTGNKQETLASLRKKHGFPNFDAMMQSHKNFDAEAEMQAQAPATPTKKNPPSRPPKKGSKK